MRSSRQPRLSSRLPGHCMRSVPRRRSLHGDPEPRGDRRDLGGLSPLRVARHSPAKVTIEFDVTPRPNWVWLAAVQGLPRPLILNGVHHLLALLKAGRQEAFGLLRPAQSLQELQLMGMNFQDPSLFNQDQLTGSSPPLLQQY